MEHIQITLSETQIWIQINQLFESHQGDVFINVLNINITIIMIKIMNFTMSVNFNK